MRLAGLLGKKAKHDIVHNGLVLVPAGVTLESSHIDLLENYRVVLEDVRLAVEAEERQPESETAAMMSQAVQFTRDMFERVREVGQLDSEAFEHTVTPIILQIAENKDMFRLFHTVKAKDEYTHQHNIGVSVLSTLIGRWLGWSDDEVALLSLAASLHDVGKVRIPDEILLKPGRLTTDEYAEMKLHTVYGYEILKASRKMNPRVALVALQHHERDDRRGYPYGIRNGEMDEMSKVVAVADIFHAMSSRRPYHEPMPFYRVVSEMRNGSFGELDPHIVGVFLEQIIRHLLGRQVKLSDGRWGEVVYLDPQEDMHPLVRVGDSFINLKQERHLHIEEIII
ncbi:HD-GYP domain-containing protein [Cohnella sp. JJ-181]|uniref:HD-GYP domain-containing protein n=1 Tax=Cohnella rhizoplanae TaxID=2974897 RepID=UPI0022FF6E48|nr:HD-GYP domain-containing protein [Cohnella sp. JJ-181]CAI6087436.1 Cyclic di-GMP phosphodiesterase [Cohnella sp. JJ-181]